MLRLLGVLYVLCSCLCRDVKPQNENYLPDYNVYHNTSAITALVSSTVGSVVLLSQLHACHCAMHIFQPSQTVSIALALV